MGREVRLFKSEERMSRPDVSAFLHQLADKLAQGSIILRQAGEEISLELPHNLKPFV